MTNLLVLTLDKFDSSTFTRPKKKLCKKQENYHFVPCLTTEFESQKGVSIN